MSEQATIALPHEAASRRPGIRVTLAWVAVGGWFGSLLAFLALVAPGLVGVASIQFEGARGPR